MRWFDRILGMPAPGKPAAQRPPDPGNPFMSGAMSQVVWNDIFGNTPQVVDYAAVMAVPAIKRGLAIITGAICDLPLVQVRRGDPIDPQPGWLTSTRGVTTSWHRMSDTIRDLAIFGWSLWLLERSDVGTILTAAHLPRAQWTFDKDTIYGIRVNDVPIEHPSQVALFRGPDEGIIELGAAVVRGARALDAAWIGRAQNPNPIVVLHEVERNGVTTAEAQSYVAAWNARRQQPGGATGFLPSTLELETPGSGGDADMFIGARNASNLDAARLLNLPGSVLDASMSTASLTYSTQEGTFDALAEWLTYWTSPIQARLSQDDICPAGNSIRFDTSGLSRQINPVSSTAPADPAAAEAAAPDPQEVPA